jgi:signal transduction histidine kinase
VEPPYTLTLAEPGAGAPPLGEGPNWRRSGDELHGDWLARLPTGVVLAHAEVELRSLDALAQRGLLVLLLDLALLALLWTVAGLADGGARRWVRLRTQRWGRSYRAQLTLVLFTFFVVPAAAFTLWSSRRLTADDVQARELLVRETLRAAGTPPSGEALRQAAERVDAPLLLYLNGRLQAVSDPLYAALAPLGRLLPPPVARALDEGELTASRLERVGHARVLVGYRQLPWDDAQTVLAAPARASDAALDRRRRDIFVLVLFATVLGAFAAFALSGVAARQLARPIGTLRRAALAVARGEREPALSGQPPREFQPVFSAFRRMAADLDASRTALEQARARTAAVLRHVASGVVAVDAEGHIVLANPAAERLLGGELPEGAPLRGRAAPRLEANVYEFARGARADEEFELELAGRQLHARLTPLQHGGGGAVLTLDDVTEIGRAQRVLAWGEMARQVAHEIKNPLTPIRLGVQHLRRAHAAGRGDFAAILEQNVARILAEIDRLDEIARSFSRYGTAPEERAPGEPTDVAATARDVVNLERLGEGQVTWAFDAPEGPVLALARGDELREVLLNVLENARHAHARCVRVTVERVASAVHVRIRDDGHGIAAEVLPRIFEPHFSTRTSGSGLGLAISRRLVEGWGGTMTVSSEPGDGAEVLVTLAATAR